MGIQDLAVAILTNNQHHAARDRQSCARLDAKSAAVFEALADALEPIRERRFQALLIDTAVRDASGCDCLLAIRKSTRTFLLPAIMVSADSSLDHVLSAIAAGCNGYVIRPYSLSTLERHLQLAIDSTGGDEIEREQLGAARDLVDQGRFDEAIGELAELVEEENEALAYFNRGMDYLHRQKFGKAIVSFNKAVAIQSMFAEAYKGLALAHQGKGDEAGYRDFLDKAAAVLAMQDRMDELKVLFVEILKANPEAVNPYNSMGIDLRRKGDYAGALHAYTRALELTPEDENLRYNIAKACVFAKDYDGAISHLEKAVALRPAFEEARHMLAKLQAKQYDNLSPPTGGIPPADGQGGLAMDL